MLLGLLFPSIVLSFFLSGGAFAHRPDSSRLASELKLGPQTVRVKLSSLGRVLTIRGTDLALSLAKKPELGNVRADEWVIDCKRSVIYQPETNKAKPIPRSGVLIESLTGILSVNQKRFREQIVIYPKELLSPYDDSIRTNPECLVVNHINLERYLESVVNGEFNSQWAQAAVEAQIIAARTYALYQMKEMRKDAGRVFDVESTQKDQVYLGMDRVDSTASQLVLKTRGMIMIPKDGVRGGPSDGKIVNPIKAFYHASCGGRTLLPEQVWGAKFSGFTKGVPCPYCSGAPSYRWDYRLSFRDVEARITKGIAVDSVGRKSWPEFYTNNPKRWFLVDVRSKNKANSLMASPNLEAHDLRESDENARPGDLIFEFVDREHIERHVSIKMNAYAARNWLDPSKLKSTWFQVRSLGRFVLFHGKGSGHGVGMCQWGAKKMGEKGFTRDQILSFYYPGVKIARLGRPE